VTFKVPYVDTRNISIRSISDLMERWHQENNRFLVVVVCSVDPEGIEGRPLKSVLVRRGRPV
jgi:hypothetical protein